MCTYFSIHKGYYDIEIKTGKPHMLTVNADLMETDFDVRGNIAYKVICL